MSNEADMFTFTSEANVKGLEYLRRIKSLKFNISLHGCRNFITSLLIIVSSLATNT